MKSSLKPLLLLLALAASPAAQAQTTVKTKIKPVGQASAKIKNMQPPVGFEEMAPLPDAAMVDAKTNALTANMQKNLGLTPQQTEKVRVINHRGVELVESSRLRYRSDPRKLANMIDVAGRSRLEALKEVLNPAQFDKYQRKREEKMGVPNAQGIQGNAAPGLGGGGAGDQ